MTQEEFDLLYWLGIVDLIDLALVEAGTSISVARPPGSAADLDNIWQNLNNISADDNTYATCLIPSRYSTQIFAYNFGFSINGTINGITVKLKGHSAIANSIFPDAIVLGFFDGANFTENGDEKNDVNYWGTTDDYRIYGSSSDLWNGVWTPDDINNPQFCVSIIISNDSSSDQTVYIDYVEVTVFYTPSSAVNLSISDSLIGLESIGIFNSFGVSDSGAGFESGTFSNSFSLQDTAVGTELLLLTLFKQISDTLGGLDNLTIQNAFNLLDSGTGNESIILLLEKLISDSATGTDLLNILNNLLSMTLQRG